MSDSSNEKTSGYNPSEIEPKWQAFWEKDQTFKTPEMPGEKKAYVLDMFPYPSGAGLHVGHPEGYTATDIVSRFLRSRGYSVLHPMGWDAFGLPAEQYAIQTGTHPSITTQKNIETFKRQIQSLGLSYDWTREIDTTDPNYVKWTQWIFLELFDRGLAFQDEVAVNWCPALGTVLSNEEVKDGKSERGDFPVYRMPLRQWMLKITAYADRLQDDLQKADWPEGTRVMQHEWIGRSEGAEVVFDLKDAEDKIEVFTTRPDTLWGATFLVLAPEHPLVPRITTQERRITVDEYVAKTKRKSEMDRRANKEKSGEFTGAYAKHPLTGKDVPIWIADYVLWGYGTGAIMAVPGHDERDFEFAKKYEIPIVRVVAAAINQGDEPLETAFAEEGVAVNSGPFSGLTTAECKAAVTSELEKNGHGKKRTEYKLRDWVFSRQRYWGEPIPVYFPIELDDPSGDPRKGATHKIRFDKPIPVAREELPLRLPELEDFKPGDDPSGPLARALDWRFFQKDGHWYARETNTMPQWAGSCWYYLRYIDPKNDAVICDKKLSDAWLPVDLYVGGAEHAVLHLLYARFWHKVLFDAGIVSCEEPFKKLVHQGMILGEIEYTTYVGEDGKYVTRNQVKPGKEGEEDKLFDAKTNLLVTPQRLREIDVTKKGERFVLKSDESIAIDARAHKMSKSRGNVINPDVIVNEFGADSLRLYEMFMGPLEATKPWSTASILGVKRFLDRAFTACTKELSTDAPTREELRLQHSTIRKVTEDIEALRLNTVVSTLMTYLNEINSDQPKRVLCETLVLLLHPLAPHIAEELWEKLGHQASVQRVAWPTFDAALCEADEVEIPVQVNGKIRAKLRVAAGASEADVAALAMADENVQKHLEGKTIAKQIYVAGKIFTLAVK